MTAVAAVALNLLREVWRGPGFAVYVLLLLTVASLAPRLGPTEDLLARLQLTVTYGLGMPVVLIAMITLVTSSGSLAHEIDRSYVQLLVTKSIARWQILMGKFLGVLLVDLLLVAVVLVVLLVQFRVALGDSSSAAETQRVEQRFLTSRVSVAAALPPVNAAQLERVVDDMKTRRGTRDGGEGALRERARRRLQTRFVRPGAEEALVFRNVDTRRRQDDLLLIRYRINYSPLPAPAVESAWRVGEEGTATTLAKTIAQGIADDLEVPVSAVSSPDLSLSVHVRNESSGDAKATLIVRPDSVEVLYPYGSFWPNLARALLIVMSHLAFLATVGLFGSALFSLPTASLLGFFVYLGGLASTFLRQSMRELLGSVADEGVGGAVVHGIGWVCLRVLDLLPEFASEDPVALLADGRALTWSDLSTGLASNLGLRAGVVFLLACWFWQRREMIPGAD